MRLLPYIFAIISVLLVVSCQKVEHYELSRFVSPETCGGCHNEIYEQWKGSMHRLSHVDKIYLKSVKHDLEGLTDPDHIKEAETCVTCHVPVGVVSGYPKKSSDDQSKVPEPASSGIQCDYCHSATGAYKVYNARMKLNPGNGESDPGIKYGPFKDSKSSYHESEFSAFHTNPEICGVCHDVRHLVYGTQLEDTYQEWQKGPYNTKDPDKRRVCQGCHMYDRPGKIVTGSTKREPNPGKASIVGGPEREHIFTHYFVGANSLIPGLYEGKEQVAMAKSKLQNCATVLVETNELKNGKLIVKVKNTGAGHKIPTGVSQIRQVWLKITVKANGREVYKSGHLDTSGYLDKKSLQYYTVFGDGKGNPVLNLAKAKEILSDKRLAPLEEQVETITGLNVRGKSVTVDVHLMYRLIPQKVADELFGKGKLVIPVIEMASDKKSIRL